MMLFRLSLFLLIILTLFVSCEDEEYLHRVPEPDSCDTVNIDTLVRLKGVAYINSKNTIIFHTSDFIEEGIYGRKMHLIPCNEGTKNYIISEHDVFLYLKNHNDYFWIEIEGKYLTPDTLDRPQEFLVRFVNICYDCIIR